MLKLIKYLTLNLLFFLCLWETFFVQVYPDLSFFSFLNIFRSHFDVSVVRCIVFWCKIALIVSGFKCFNNSFFCALEEQCNGINIRRFFLVFLDMLPVPSLNYKWFFFSFSILYIHVVDLPKYTFALETFPQCLVSNQASKMNVEKLHLCHPT